jgi:hypothetical protein
MSRPILHFLIILDLCWAGAALLYDLPAIARIPLWALPFIVICPVYPALLAGIWILLLFGRVPHPLYFYAGVLPSLVYGVLALGYYPLSMLAEGFSWNGLLQIPWVLVYALQAWVLLRAYPINQGYLPACLFLLVSWLVQLRTGTYGYLGLGQLPPSSQGLLFLLALITLLSTISHIRMGARQKKHPQVTLTDIDITLR